MGITVDYNDTKSRTTYDHLFNNNKWKSFTMPRPPTKLPFFSCFFTWWYQRYNWKYGSWGSRRHKKLRLFHQRKLSLMLMNLWWLLRHRKFMCSIRVTMDSCNGLDWFTILGKNQTWNIKSWCQFPTLFFSGIYADRIH